MTEYLNYQCVLYNRSAMVLISLKCILNPVLKKFMSSFLRIATGLVTDQGNILPCFMTVLKGKL